jgi:DNA-binding protein HU-beta
MIKTELIARVAEVSGLMLGFGTFCTTKRAATTGRTPKTGESISIPAKTLPRFKPGQRLKDAVAG